MPSANKLQVSSLNNPARLVIDVRADAPTAKEIALAEGITWQQQFIRLGKNTFPVTWLEIDPKSPKISLKPIATNLNGLEGTGSVVNLANLWQASAAINGGFFNRNTKQPLGAIRQEGLVVGANSQSGRDRLEQSGKNQSGTTEFARNFDHFNGTKIAYFSVK